MQFFKKPLLSYEIASEKVIKKKCIREKKKTYFFIFFYLFGLENTEKLVVYLRRGLRSSMEQI